jgi:hypothetical protein
VGVQVGEWTGEGDVVIVGRPSAGEVDFACVWEGVDVLVGSTAVGLGGMVVSGGVVGL